MWHERRSNRRPSKLKAKWFPEQSAPNRPQQLAGRTAVDIVDAAFAIASDEMAKKAQRCEDDMEKRRKAKIAAISLQKMPWDDDP